MNIQTYLDHLSTRYKAGNSTEHTFRPDFQVLLETMLPGIMVTNEPTRIKCGAPDYILTKNDIPLGYIEAKDIGADLNNRLYKEQFDRYKAALGNLVITNYIDFLFFKEGDLVATYSLGKLEGNKVVPNEEHFAPFSIQIKEFARPAGQTIKSAQKLAEMMAIKAKWLADVIFNALESDEKNEENSTLKDQLKAFQNVLIHDIQPKDFADIYAQTIAYGMFAARLHDTTLDTFSRKEAAELIPKTNPFLRRLFQYIAGYDLDTRIIWIVDALADIFRATDIKAILKNFGKDTRRTDPIIHFYETFLSEYDPKLRKARGVWYTPEPVVNFIVRAVDDILKTEFGLPEGLADTSKTKIKRIVQNKATADMRSKIKDIEIEEEVHKVQILDPATGTGTFLAEVVKHIYSGKFEGQEGIWSGYVESHLLPRINGFELLMASYAMAHLKLELLLSETGYHPKSEQRLRVYLTNSLEESHPETGTLFANWLSSEANEANQIKRDTPVMVVMGNPPYSGESANKGKWIQNLMEDYKKEPGGIEKLKERNSKWVNADENKFIRFGQYFIEKNANGILAFINPHSFLDNPIGRGMRWNLLKTFDKIYVIDLHGNNTKKEVCPDGSPDINVFDIKQGVSINIFVKTGKKKTNELGKVFHHDLYGKREFKYDFLFDNTLDTVPFLPVEIQEPNYFFVPKGSDNQRLNVVEFETKNQNEYFSFLKITDLLPFKTSGIKSHDDANLISHSEIELKRHIEAINHTFDNSKTLRYSYRPFDNEFIYYDINLLGRAREKTIYHLAEENLGLVLVAQSQAANLNHFDCVYLTNELTDTNMFRRGGPSIFPLYLYPKTGQHELHNNEGRRPNISHEIAAQIGVRLNLCFVNNQSFADGTFAPIDILDYIYATLHSPTYREKYKEFLKIDFPRIPYPKDTQTFWAFVALGSEIRQLHLLESPIVSKLITKYPISGNDVVGKPVYKDGRVYINDIQYFEDVPQVAWEFYIGGYQPAQKWLKDRKDRTLNFEDILHYQKMIVALYETDRIMKEIDKVDFV
jgi:predicted helicase